MTYTVAQLHKLFVPMIQEFDSFCRSQGLRYFIDGGTLLGAVREGGFIRWDDDVDIVMPRPDYERLIAEWDGGMILHCHEKDKNYLFPYIKLFHSTMPVIEIEDDSTGIYGRVFLKIDLYPMDGVATSNLKRLRQLKSVQCKKRLLFLLREKQKPGSMFKRIVFYFLNMIPENFIYNRLNHAMQKYKYEHSKIVTRWRIHDNEIALFEKEKIEPLSNIAFEGMVLLCPANSDVYLRKTYGDYLLPIRQNDGLRHSTEASVLAKDFENYILGK